MGNPLVSPFRKNFRVGQPDETSPDPKNWKMSAPRAGTREPLEVRFPEPLDRALLDRLISVQDATARAVPGQISVGEFETLWRFTPLDAVESRRLFTQDWNRARGPGRKQRGSAIRGRRCRPDLKAGHDGNCCATVSNRPGAPLSGFGSPAAPEPPIRWSRSAGRS